MDGSRRAHRRGATRHRGRTGRRGDRSGRACGAGRVDLRRPECDPSRAAACLRAQWCGARALGVRTAHRAGRHDRVSGAAGAAGALALVRPAPAGRARRRLRRARTGSALCTPQRGRRRHPACARDGSPGSGSGRAVAPRRSLDRAGDRRTAAVRGRSGRGPRSLVPALVRFRRGTGRCKSTISELARSAFREESRSQPPVRQARREPACRHRGFGRGQHRDRADHLVPLRLDRASRRAGESGGRAPGRLVGAAAGPRGYRVAPPLERRGAPVPLACGVFPRARQSIRRVACKRSLERTRLGARFAARGDGPAGDQRRLGGAARSLAGGRRRRVYSGERPMGRGGARCSSRPASRGPLPRRRAGRRDHPSPAGEERSDRRRRRGTGGRLRSRGAGRGPVALAFGCH